jgi:hypothetical protein
VMAGLRFIGSYPGSFDPCCPLTSLDIPPA